MPVGKNNEEILPAINAYPIGISFLLKHSPIRPQSYCSFENLALQLLIFTALLSMQANVQMSSKC